MYVEYLFSILFVTQQKNLEVKVKFICPVFLTLHGNKRKLHFIKVHAFWKKYTDTLNNKQVRK